jgi:UrcA family protein
MKTLTSFAVITITGALLSASASVLADGNAYDARTKVVEFADLNVGNPNDAQVLLQRIQSAAEKTCNRARWSQDPVGSDRARCEKSAYQDAVAQIDGRFNIDLEGIAGVAQHGNELATSK